MYNHDEDTQTKLKVALPSVEELLKTTTMNELLRAKPINIFESAESLAEHYRRFDLRSKLDIGSPMEYTYNPLTNTYIRMDGHQITPELYQELITETTTEHAEDPMDVVSNYEQQGILSIFARVIQNIYTRRVEIEENDELKLNPFSYREQLKQVDEDLNYVLTLMTGHNRPQGTLTISALHHLLQSRGLL